MRALKIRIDNVEKHRWLVHLHANFSVNIILLSTEDLRQHVVDETGTVDGNEY